MVMLEEGCCAVGEPLVRRLSKGLKVDQRYKEPILVKDTRSI